MAVRLNGDIVFWSTDGVFSVEYGHKDTLGSAVPDSEGKNLWYTSETNIFIITKDEKKTKLIASSHTLGVDRLTANKWAVFSSGFDKLLCRFEDEKETQKTVLPNKLICLEADEDSVYGLTVNSDVLVVDARTLEIKQNKKVNFSATALTVCGGHIWIGDKDGKIHILDHSLTEIKLIDDKHKKGISVLASNGKVVASGDCYRYTFVFDGTTHDELFNFGDTHTDKLYDLYLTETHLLSVS